MSTLHHVSEFAAPFLEEKNTSLPGVLPPVLWPVPPRPRVAPTRHVSAAALAAADLRWATRATPPRTPGKFANNQGKTCVKN